MFDFAVRTRDYLSNLYADRAAGFSRDEDGSVVVIFAVLLLPLLVMAGAGLDYARASQARGDIQAALDAAVLSGTTGRSIYDEESVVKQRIQSLYDNNMPSDLRNSFALTIEINREEQSIKATAKGTIPTTMMKLVHINDMDIEVTSTAVGGDQEVIVDIAMCIDATGSMYNTLQAVKVNALAFDQNLIAAIEAKGRQLDKVNIRPIYYRDFEGDGQNAIKYGNFYKLPEQRGLFQAYVNNKSPSGGGDWPEAGMECFYAAMKTDWTEPVDRSQVVYPVIAIWTDAPADSPSNPSNRNSAGGAVISSSEDPSKVGQPLYPAGMPSSYYSLQSVWKDSSVIDQDKKTAVFFGPHTANAWNTVRHWNNFQVGGSVTDGNNHMVELIAEAIYKKLPPPRLAR